MVQTQAHNISPNGIQSFVEASSDYELAPIGLGSMREQVEKLAEYGRCGDIYVVHAAEGETVIPMEVLEANPKIKSLLFNQMAQMGLDPERYVVGNELNSINPVTGMPEFWGFSKIFKSAKKAVKSVAKLVKKVAPIVLPIAASAFGFPAFMGTAFGAGTFGAAALGSGIGTLLGGGGLKDAFKAAAFGGITSLASNELFSLASGKDFGASFGPSFTGAGTGPSYGGDFGGPASMASVQAARAAAPAVGPGGMAAVQAARAATSPLTALSRARLQNLASTGAVPTPLFDVSPGLDVQLDPMALYPQVTGISTPFIPSNEVQLASLGGATFDTPAAPRYTPDAGPSLMAGAPAPPTSAAPIGSAPWQRLTAPVSPTPTVQYYGSVSPNLETGVPPEFKSTFESMQPITAPDSMVQGGITRVTADNYGEFSARIAAEADKAMAIKNSGLWGTILPGDLTTAELATALNEVGLSATPEILALAAAEASPGFLAKYGPLAAGGLGLASLTGAFEPGEIEEVGPEDLAGFTSGPTGPELLAADPGKYTVANLNPFATPPDPNVVIPTPLFGAHGGSVNYPRKVGYINGPGTGTSDEIPAMLSDGEFVMTKRAVDGAGGPRTMYNMMRNFEMRS